MKVSITVDFDDASRFAIVDSEARKATRKEIENFMHMAVQGSLDDCTFDFDKTSEDDALAKGGN